MSDATADLGRLLNAYDLAQNPLTGFMLTLDARTGFGLDLRFVVASRSEVVIQRRWISRP